MRQWLLFFSALAVAATLSCGVALLVPVFMATMKTAYPSDGVFIADVDGPHGEYEEGAYWYKLEPRAIAAARSATLLVLGDSRAQFGFSTEATQTFFDNRNIPYHLLAFGHVQASPFAVGLIERLSLRPKVAIINVDPFFSLTTPEPGHLMLRGDWATQREYYLKRAAHLLRDVVCRYGMTCVQANPTLLRDSRNGHWIWENVLTKDVAHPVFDLDKVGKQTAIAANLRDIAGTTLDVIGIPRQCIIFTDVPNEQIDSRQLATELARDLGTTVIIPDVEGLTTLDQSHLNKQSAQRWSAAFLERAAPIIDRCTAR